MLQLWQGQDLQESLIASPGVGQWPGPVGLSSSSREKEICDFNKDCAVARSLPPPGRACRTDPRPPLRTPREPERQTARL